MIPTSPSMFSSDFSHPVGEDSVVVGFKKENICGEGASSLIYSLRINGLRVAAKRMRSQYLTNPTFVASYRKEYEIGQRLRHDALPIYRDLRIDDEEVYIIMDYIDGITLSDFLKTDEGQQFFSSKENVRRVLKELLNVISYIHRAGVIHCDIKTANIILRHSDRAVMLIDFDKAYTNTSDLTHGGTPGICDPVAAGEKPTAKKDFHALSSVFEEIKNKTPKFPSRHFKSFYRECKKENPSPETLLKSLKPNSRLKLWIIETATIAAIIGIGAYFRPSPTDSSPSPSSSSSPSLHAPESSPNNPEETASITPTAIPSEGKNISPTAIPSEGKNISPTAIPSEGKNISPTAIPLEESKKIRILDFDNRMAQIIKETEAAINLLSKGQLTPRQRQDKLYELNLSYSQKYQEILAAYRAENPAIDPLEIEQELINAQSKSHAQKLLSQFIKASADSASRNH